MEMLKNKVFSLVLAVLMLAGSGQVFIPAQANTPNYGDVDGNGIINSADVTLLRRRVAQGNENNLPNSYNRANADVNGDGTIDANDVTLLRRYVAATDPSTVPLGPLSVKRDLLPSDFPAGTRYIALTFDDGPNTHATAGTVGVLNYLQSHVTPVTLQSGGRNLTGPAFVTFYINGANINDQTRPVLTRMITEGHDVDNHGFNHYSHGGAHQDSPVILSTQAQARESLRSNSQAIFTATGYWPFSFRAPFFEWGAQLIGLDAELRMAFMDAGIDSNDWMAGNQSNPSGMASSIRNNAGDGAVILMHDAPAGQRAGTVNSLQHFMPQLQDQNYAWVTVRQMFRLKNAVPEQFEANHWPRVNQWVPHRRPASWGQAPPLWTGTPWWTSDSNPTPPWQR
jgi:peptidoglycan/xylan/chitin deacetylase (PgdA/CDA1 family)